jgi:hypothetical protein
MPDHVHLFFRGGEDFRAGVVGSVS